MLIIFDTSGSMANIIWLDGFDPTVDYSTPLLSEGKEVVFAREKKNCFPDNHRVTFQTSEGRVKLRYRKCMSSTKICSGSDYQTRWSEADGYFYFDRRKGTFIDQDDYDPGDSQHIKAFLPYATYSVDVRDTGAYSTWYNFNYLNWIFYYSTQAQRDALKALQDDPAKRDLLTRILTAKRAVKEVFRSTTEVRFGLMIFDGSEGGEIKAGIPSSLEDLDRAVNEIWASGYTPLAEALEDAWDYFSDKQEGPVQYWCQKNFVILITDGLPTRDGDDLSDYMKKDWDGDSGGTEANGWKGDETGRYPGQGSDYLDDIAYHLYQSDARPDLQREREKRNIVTYTIGFTVSSRLLLNTAFNGNGLHGQEAEWSDPNSPLYHRYFYTADDFQGLRRALEKAMREVLMSISSGTGAAVVSTATSTKDLVFRASFHPAGWKGFLEAFEVDGDVDFDRESPRWEAGALLNATSPEDRSIWTALKSSTGMDEKVEFSGVNLSATGIDNKELCTLLGAADAEEGEAIVDFVRGHEIAGLRRRGGHRLGDIVHSTPVVVGPPNWYFTDLSYILFRRSKTRRERMVYVGSNDGMIHAFYVDDPNGGKEAWAFIPNNLLGKLKVLTDPDYDDCHQYFVDLTPTVVDVFIDPDGEAGGLEPQWRTLLIGGERQGGKAYFALDVTDPGADGFEPKWEFSDPHLGESWSIPAVEKIFQSGRTEGRWVAFVGSGFNNDDGKGYLLAFDLETGKNLDGTPLLVSVRAPNMLTSPRAVDINEDEYADSVFTADLFGKVYRLDITCQETPKTYEPLEPAAWKVEEIFQARDRNGQIQPITQPVGLSFYCKDPSDRRCRNLMVYFGTGSYLTLDDKKKTSDQIPLQSFYGIKDEFRHITRDQEGMKDRTVSGDCEENPDPTKIKGWYVDLRPGERVSSPPLVVGGLVFFLTFIPIDDPCQAGGKTYLYYREFDTGCVPNRTVFKEEDPDPPGEARPVGRIEIGRGYASELLYYAKTSEMLIQTSDHEIHGKTAVLGRSGLSSYSWREVFY
ncbi:MAG: VWA domain-containing protein [Deltaproteobacteria bacterium]|nr:VWA domain-containing protein [Deltaproteobacteria bacterium]